MTHFTITAHGDRYAIAWTDETARYHVWSLKRGGLEDRIYVNKFATQGTRDHKITRRSLHNHPKLVKAIVAIPQDEYLKADLAAQIKEDQRVAEAQRQHYLYLEEEARKAGYKLVPLDGYEQACGHLTDEEGNPLPRVTVKENVAKFNID